MIQNLSVGEHFETSDHQVIRFDLLSKKIENKASIVRYDYFRADYDEVRKQMHALQLETSNININKNVCEVEYRWSSIKENCLSVRSEYIGKKKEIKK